MWITLFLICALNPVVLSQTFDASGWCQSDNNVNCSNWPSAIEDVKRAVFHFSNSSSNCTGTLIRGCLNVIWYTK